MSTRLAQREVLLAGVALLAGLLALALVLGRSNSGQSLPKPVGAWRSALAGVRAPGGIGTRTGCGQILRADTNGVSHPVLPCGAKIFLEFGDKHVLTQVIDRGPFVPGREFDLTEPLAATLGITSVSRIRWAYATAR